MQKELEEKVVSEEELEKVNGGFLRADVLQLLRPTSSFQLASLRPQLQLSPHQLIGVVPI